MVGSRPAGMPHPPPPTAAFYPDWREAGAALSLLDLPGRAMCALRIGLRRGSATEPAERSGITSAALRSALAGQLVPRLERLGAEASATATVDAAAVTLTAPAPRIAEAAALTLDALARPLLDGGDIANVLAREAAAAREAGSRPGTRAAQALLSAVYGPASGLSRHPRGQPSTIETISADEVREHYRGRVLAAGARLAVAGDLARCGGLDALDGALPGTAAPVAACRAPEPPRTVAIDLRKAAQSVFACGCAVLVGSLEEAAALEAAVQVLAGWYGSRWHVRLRDREGLTYHVGTELAIRRTADGCMCEVRILTAVSPEAGEAAVTAMRDELERLAGQPVDGAELGPAVAWAIQSQRLYLQTPEQIVGLHGQLFDRGHPAGYGRQRGELLLSVDGPALRAAAERYLRPDRMVLVGAGRPDAVVPALASW